MKRKTIIIGFITLLTASCDRGRPSDSAARITAFVKPENAIATKFSGVIEDRSDGIDRLTTYFEGRQSGPCVEWHGNGMIAGCGTLVDGVEYGYWNYWFATGGIAAEGRYKNGLTNGVWLNYHMNGQLSAEMHFVDEVLMGPTKAWDSAGTLTSEGVFIDGCKDGVWVVLDDQFGTYSLEIWDYGMLTKQIPMCE